jgi:foldase protein PrsA
MRKLLWTAAVLLFIAGAVWLTLFSSKSLVTSSAGAITENEYLKQVTSTSEGQNTFIQMVTEKVLEKEYGKDVSDKNVEDALNQTKAQYGDAFASLLSSAGQTEDSYKSSLRTNLLMIQLIKNNQKFTDKQIQKAYDSYVPTMNVSLISVADQDTANKALAALDKGDKFADVAKKYSTDTSSAANGGKIPGFDSTSTVVSTDILDAAKKLTAGEYTKTAIQTSSGYSIIKMDSIAKKGKIAEYRNILTNSLATTWMSDSKNQSSMQKILGKLMQKYNVTMKDQNLTGLKQVLDSYIISATNQSSSTSSSTSSSSSSK